MLAIKLVWFLMLIHKSTPRFKYEEKLLINTTGCQIPNVHAKYQDETFGPPCRGRDIEIIKIHDDTRIRFVMKKHFGSCCYSFIYRSNVPGLEDLKVRYSPCLPFTNNTEAEFIHEFIGISCRQPALQDYFAFVKKFDGIEDQATNNSWNVLLIGLSSMSRARAHRSLSQTVGLLNKFEWLDFQGYNKIEMNTIRNLIAILTGENYEHYEKEVCDPDISTCNDMLIWHDFEEAGYATAFGENDFYLNSNFEYEFRFKEPPTHHYMKPLFLAGEKIFKGKVCTRTISSGQHILNYILDYAETYKNNKFFGLFYISTASDVGYSLMQFDEQLVEFLEKLGPTGAYDSTIIILFSDTGVRFGPMRYPIEAYYEERLPMLFMWTPLAFREAYERKYLNLITNQNRLTSPFDVHLTLVNILDISRSKGSKSKRRASGCERCVSLFRNILNTRTCSQAGIPEKWCSCHGMTRANLSDIGTRSSLIVAVEFLENISKLVPTKPCTRCRNVFIKKLLRVHSYAVENKSNEYYVMAFITMPQDIIFELTVLRHLRLDKYKYGIVSFIRISQYTNNDYCTDDIAYKNTCDCQTDEKCAVETESETNKLNVEVDFRQ